MNDFAGLPGSCSLDDMLHYLLREEENAEEKLMKVEKVLDPFWDQVETLYPDMSRHDDRFFMLVTRLIADIETASFKLGFLQGVSLAQEIIAAK